MLSKRNKIIFGTTHQNAHGYSGADRAFAHAHLYRNQRPKDKDAYRHLTHAELTADMTDRVSRKYYSLLAHDLQTVVALMIQHGDVIEVNGQFLPLVEAVQ
jgi:hypothetical protein